MRTAAQYIDELEYEGQAATKLGSEEVRLSSVGLAVLMDNATECFTSETLYVLNEDGDREEKISHLNELLREHGKPIAKFAMVLSGTEMTFYAKALAEFEDDPCRPKYMEDFSYINVLLLECLYPNISVKRGTGWLS